jgi:hypothetical protein
METERERERERERENSSSKIDVSSIPFSKCGARIMMPEKLALVSHQRLSA